MQTNFSPHVLVVDDDVLILETFRVILETSGFTCCTATDGFAALTNLVQSPFDLVITDLRMPKMSGLELLKIIRQRFPQLAVIVISSEATPTAQKLKLPIAAYLQKDTFTHEQLISTMRELLKRSKKQDRGDLGRTKWTSPQRKEAIGADAGIGAISKGQAEEEERQRAGNGTRFSIEDDSFGGFRVRGLYDPEEQAWRVKTWPAGRYEPEHDYWVRDGDLYTVRLSAVGREEYWRPGSMGSRTITVDRAERQAIMHLITRWELKARRSA